MTFMVGSWKGLAAVLISALALGLFGVTAAPTTSFTMSPDGNPVVGQMVQFTDTSTAGPTSWSWNFGDGQTSTDRNPAHAYGGPGPYNVTLTAGNGSGSSQQTAPLIVSPVDTLRLNSNGGHPFIVKLVATNQHNGNVQGTGQAIPQNDLFGFFSFPSLTNNPSNPEVFVKILDGRTINGEFWVFYGHLTDLIYDLTVTEVSTGFVKTYHKDAGARASGDADTSGFHATPTPTGSSTTPTPTPTPTPSGSSTRIVDVGANGTKSFMDAQSGGPFTTIQVGDTVKWVWHSTTMYHSTTSGVCTTGGGGYGTDTCTSDGLWDSGLRIVVNNQTPTFSQTFTTAGTFKYYCMEHLSLMTGTVQVVP
jgi:PKD repeat protein